MDTDKKSEQEEKQDKQSISDTVGDLVVSAATVLAHSAAEAVVARVKRQQRKDLSTRRRRSSRKRSYLSPPSGQHQRKLNPQWDGSHSERKPRRKRKSRRDERRHLGFTVDGTPPWRSESVLTDQRRIELLIPLSNLKALRLERCSAMPTLPRLLKSLRSFYPYLCLRFC